MRQRRGAPGAGASDGDTDSEVGLDSPEGAGQLARRVCVESSTAPESYSVATQADVDALEGCSEIQGSLDLGLSAPVDLRALAQLRRVHGRLSISSRLDSSQPIIEQSLVGLEALEEVHSLTLGHPGITSLEPSARRAPTPSTAARPSTEPAPSRCRPRLQSSR